MFLSSMMDLVKTLQLEDLVKQYGLENIIDKYGLIILGVLVVLVILVIVLICKLLGKLFDAISKRAQKSRAKKLKKKLHYKHYYYGSFDVGSHGGINQYACGFRWNFDVYFNDKKSALAIGFNPYTYGAEICRSGYFISKITFELKTRKKGKNVVVKKQTLDISKDVAWKQALFRKTKLSLENKTFYNEIIFGSYKFNKDANLSIKIECSPIYNNYLTSNVYHLSVDNIDLNSPFYIDRNQLVEIIRKREINY